MGKCLPLLSKLVSFVLELLGKNRLLSNLEEVNAKGPSSSIHKQRNVFALIKNRTGYPGTHTVDQAGLELTAPHSSAS